MEEKFRFSRCDQMCMPQFDKDIDKRKCTHEKRMRKERKKKKYAFERINLLKYAQNATIDE